MGKIYNRYIKNVDHTWYDSSNIVYSACFDGVEKILKIVFKGGKQYLYRNVEPNDYVLFRDAESSGKAFNIYIKKYPCEKLNDVDLNEIEKLKDTYQNKVGYSPNFQLIINNETGEFALIKDNEHIFNGIEGQVSIINLLRSCNFNCTITDINDVDTNTTPIKLNETIEDFINN